MRTRQRKISRKNKERLKHLGQKIAERRKLQKFSQEELAAVIEIDRGYLSTVENGHANPTVDLLYKIQDILEMDIFI
jgi:transcriptional regulator with XRE-family HTH domain